LKFNIKTGLKICGCVFLLYLAIFYWEHISGFITGAIGASGPLVVGAVIAYLVNILMSFYEKHYFPKSTNKFVKTSRRPFCLIFAFITLLGIGALIVVLIIPNLIDCIRELISALPGVLDSATDFVTTKLTDVDFIPKNVLKYLQDIDWASRVNQIFNWISTGMGNFVTMIVKTITSVFTGIISLIMSVVFAIYLLYSKEKLARQINSVLSHYTKESFKNRFLYVVRIFDKCFHRYIVGQCTEALILGILCTIGMAILGLPYPTMIGTLIAFTALIPIAGAYIGAGIGAFLILVQNPIDALIFLIFIVILQQFEGNVIYPKVVGTSIGLPSVWVLTAVVIGSGLFGIVGLLVGVPLTAAFYRILKDDLKKRKEKAKLQENPQAEQ